MAEVKSDGGSSSYYELELPDHVIAKIKEDLVEGRKPTIETGDVIEMLVDNDFDFGNVIKAIRRVWQSIKGKGKAGTSAKYDMKKIQYFLAEATKRRSL